MIAYYEMINLYVSKNILALVYPFYLGFGWAETTHLLRYNGVF